MMAQFSSKKYEMVAEVLKNNKQYALRGTLYKFWLNVVLDFAAMFEEDNPKFNTAKFFEACGYTEML